MNDEKGTEVEPSTPDGGLRKWSVIAVLGAAAFIIIIDTTIMNVSISNVVSDLDTTVTAVQGAITLYALVMASFMITGGKLGGQWGRKRAFIMGTILFAIGSGITGFAANTAMLVIGWSIIEGLGAALMLPAIWALTAANYKGKDRAISTAVIAGVIGAGSALGPIIGGWITKSYGWRVAFRLEVVIAVLVLAFTFLIKKEPVEEKPKLDYPGIVLSVTGMGLVVYGILQSSNWGLVKARPGAPFTIFGTAPTLFVILAGLVVLAFFAAWQRRLERTGGEPLVKISIFREKFISIGLSDYTLLMLVQVGLLFTIPLYMQKVLKLDALQTGIGLLPMSFTLLLGSLVSPRLTRRFYPKHIVTAGMALLGVGCFILAFGTPTNVTRGDMIPGLIVIGLGAGLAAPQLTNVILSSAPPGAVNDASALNSTFGQLGNAVGTALLGAVLITALAFGIGGYVAESEVLTPEIKAQIEEAVQHDVQVVSDEELRSKLEGQPENISQEIIRINTEANKDAFGMTLFVAGVIAILGLFVALLLPRKRLEDLEKG